MPYDKHEMPEKLKDILSVCWEASKNQRGYVYVTYSSTEAKERAFYMMQQFRCKIPNGQTNTVAAWKWLDCHVRRKDEDFDLEEYSKFGIVDTSSGIVFAWKMAGCL